jgi:hypothetical protein
MKSHIAFIISGQMRSNSLHPSNNDSTIIDSWTSNIFTEEFKSKYEYDVFISTDSISNEKAKLYFNDHLKNTHITETDTFLYNWDINKNPYEYYDAKYKIINYGDHINYIYAAYQYYRMYCSYKMMKEYIKQTGVTYKYIVRLRPDSQIMQNIIILFNILETTDIQFITEHEQLCIMTYRLKDIFKLVKHYGTYLDPVTKKNIYNFMTRNIPAIFNERVMMYAPEKQFIDHVYYTIAGLNLDFLKSFLGIRYPSYNLLYRGGGIYGHITDDSIIVPWKPFDSNQIILNKIGGDSM